VNDHAQSEIEIIIIAFSLSMFNNNTRTVAHSTLLDNSRDNDDVRRIVEIRKIATSLTNTMITDNINDSGK